MPQFLTKIGEVGYRWTRTKFPWTNVYGLARTILAAGTALTLLFNEAEVFFRPASGIPDYPLCRGIGFIGIFCTFNPHLEVARWISIIILLIVASGWRPRYTALFHWWISFSLQTAAMTLDGGDQVTAVLTFLLLPIALTDNRKWHWQRVSVNDKERGSELLSVILARAVAVSSLLAIRFQVAVIYFHAALAKLSVDEWIDGTVLYYWFTDPSVGLPGWLSFITPVFTTPLVAIITWSSVALEVFLFMAWMMPKKRWHLLLIAGILFHLSIALAMGLISFGLAMTAALILYLRPFEKEFSFFLHLRIRERYQLLFNKRSVTSE